MIISKKSTVIILFILTIINISALNDDLGNSIEFNYPDNSSTNLNGSNTLVAFFNSINTLGTFEGFSFNRNNLVYRLLGINTYGTGDCSGTPTYGCNQLTSESQCLIYDLECGWLPSNSCEDTFDCSVNTNDDDCYGDNPFCDWNYGLGVCENQGYCNSNLNDESSCTEYPASIHCTWTDTSSCEGSLTCDPSYTGTTCTNITGCTNQVLNGYNKSVTYVDDLNASIINATCINLRDGQFCGSVPSGGNSSWNETKADLKYYLNTNPSNYFNSSSYQSYNATYAGLINNASYLSTYNVTYHGLINNASYLSTYNATYDAKISFNNTNLAYTNNSNQFTKNQSFLGDINISGNTRWLDNQKAIMCNDSVTGQMTRCMGFYGGNQNTFIGIGAGSTNNVGTFTANTAFGQYALTSVTSGTSNLAIGRIAMWQLTQGSSNTALGNGVLSDITTSEENTAMGSLAMEDAIGNANTAMGLGALHSGSGGVQFNTGVGYQTGYLLGSGMGNTFIGKRAGFSQTKGDGNLIFGISVDAPNTTGNGQLNIGNTIYGSDIYYSQYTQSSTPKADANIGIGIVVNSTSDKLEVKGNIKAYNNVTVGNILNLKPYPGAVPCTASVNNSFMANATGTYGCNVTGGAVKLF